MPSLMPSLQTLTLGCSKNRVDTEHILSRLEGIYDILPEDGTGGPCDVFLLNTCGFIGDAKEESIAAILEAVGRKKRGEIGRLVVFGCLSQRYSAEMPELIPEVDAWFGAVDFTPLLSYLGADLSEEKNPFRHLTTPRHYAFLKISEGCDRRCSYCAIPFIRGKHRSVPMDELVEEARLLASKGVRELIVIAQDTTYYGLDLYRRRALAELLQRLSEVDGIEWIRIHYSYPADFPEDVLDQMATNTKVCRYMDIPLQHISDTVLDNMHRNVSGDWTRKLIRRMRERVPGVVLRTTMIVGHPGEGRKEFGELLDFVARTKQRRLDRLMSLQRDISLEFNRSRIGTEVRVIVDGYSDGMLVCRSEFESPEVDGEIYVRYRGDRDPAALCGQFIQVRIVGADEYDLTAEMISE